MSEVNILKYKNADDRLYGIAGMALGLFIFDAEKYIDHLDGDIADIEAIAFTPDFYVYSAPQVSAKAVWKALLSRHKILTAMIMGNLLCRSRMGSRAAIDPETLTQAINVLALEADDMLGLTPEENREIALQSYDYLRRAFQHGAVMEFISDLHSTLKQSSRLSRSDLFDMFEQLR